MSNLIFTDINQLKQQIERNSKQLDLRGISLGKVCYINEKKQVKVLDANSNQNYVTHWLKPTLEIREVYKGDYVLYSYPTYHLSDGIYFSVFHSDHDSNVDPGSYATMEQVIEAIDNALATYDDSIKSWVDSHNYASESWVLNQNYTTLANAQYWVLNQNYTTLPIVQSWVTSQNYATLSQLNNPLNIWRYGVNYFFQGSKGNVAQISDQYADRHITLMCLGSRLPNTGGSQDAAPEIGLTLDGSATGLEQRFDIDTEIYLRINTTARIHVKWFNGITVNGVLNSGATPNTGTLMPMRTTWKLTKTALKTWRLSEVAFNFVPYN